EKAGVLEIEMNAVSGNPWWTLPENFDVPLLFFMKDNSNTLIQPDRQFTASVQTQITVAGPHNAKGVILLGPFSSKQDEMDRLVCPGKKSPHNAPLLLTISWEPPPLCSQKGAQFCSTMFSHSQLYDGSKDDDIQLEYRSAALNPPWRLLLSSRLQHTI
ncbi:hypothetical protein U0070_011461, partial [Myodes glareolus]